MTRRLVRMPPWATGQEDRLVLALRSGKIGIAHFTDGRMDKDFICPYGLAGDHLFVRERVWERPARTERDMREGADTWPAWEYNADLSEGDCDQLREWGWRSRPSIHMPRVASRLVLIVARVWVERLHAITTCDALCEGVAPAPGMTPTGAFACLWDEINGARAPWSSNPWVWVVQFARVGNK